MNKKISTSICLGLGDNIVARIIFDTVKHEYDMIRISHDKNIMRIYRNGETAYADFLRDIGNLLFTEPPYIFDNGNHPAIHTLNTVKNLSAVPTGTNLQHLLCKGESLNLGEEYIVITTKIRGVPRRKFLPQSIQLWKVLRQLSQKYKIVILGEREVEKNFEYKNMSEIVYGIYEQIIVNLPSDRLVDLTIPALGISAPTLPKIQQDGLIMKEAKFVITFGLGGNIWLAAVTTDHVIGYRDPEDNDHAANLILNPNFTSVKMFKNWDEFVKKIEES